MQCSIQQFNLKIKKYSEWKKRYKGKAMKEKSIAHGINIILEAIARIDYCQKLKKFESSNCK